mgnify:CR=1 FL=1
MIAFSYLMICKWLKDFDSYSLMSETVYLGMDVNQFEVNQSNVLHRHFFVSLEKFFTHME